MANHSITIENSIGVFGPAPSNKWGDYNWNAFTWGEGNEDLPVWVVTQYTANAIALSMAIYTRVTKFIGQTLTVAADMGSEVLKNGDWTYNFTDRATDAEDRDTATWTGDPEESTTWTEDAEENTEWS